MKTSIKAARVLADLTQQELCDAAKIPLITLRRIEGRPSHRGLVSDDVVARVIATLEDKGIQFLENGSVSAGLGVAMKTNDGDDTL